MLQTILRNKFTYWILALYFIAIGWWLYLQSNEDASSYYFYAYYSSISLSGGLYAIRTSFKKWGGTKSVIGRGVIGLGIGLLAQTFGLWVYTYYNIVAEVAIPYPSLADIGYFMLIPAYTYAALMFAWAAGAKFSLKSGRGKLQVLLIPVIALIAAYWLFLRDTSLDLSDPIRSFLDAGYPLGEIIPVSIALLTLTLSAKLLGGTMRSRIQFLVFAFFLQFVAEYTYLYLVATERFVDGSWSDLLYFTSYAVMSLVIISFSEYE